MKLTPEEKHAAWMSKRRDDKRLAAEHGIPKSLQMYCKRYGQSVIEVVQRRLQLGR